MRLPPIAVLVTMLAISGGLGGAIHLDSLDDFDVIAEAASRPELVASAKPLAVWNNADMLWIKARPDGTPTFVLNRAVQIGDGPVNLALATPGFATVGVGAGKLRLEPDQFAEIGNGAVAVVPGEVVGATIEVGADEVFWLGTFRRDHSRAARDDLVRGGLAAAEA